MVRFIRALSVLLIISAVALSPPAASVKAAPAVAASAAGDVDLTASNRIDPVAGMPDWSGAGYLGGRQLPTDADLAGGSCTIDQARLAAEFGVRGDDGVDDSRGLQTAIDKIRSTCSPTANTRRLSLITLPAGRLDISRQIYVDASYLVIRGQGGGTGGTRIVFRPDVNTRYDTLTPDGSRWNQDAMRWGASPDEGTGGWLWPGRALFKVQTREVAARYADEWSSAPVNRKDLFEGSVNQHWVAGVKLAADPDEPGFSARAGQTVIHLDGKAKMDGFRVGDHVWVGAANSRKFYEEQGLAPDDPGNRENLHMRQQMFRALAVDKPGKTVTLDRPLEFDVPVDSTSDGSEPIGGSSYASKITPLRIVEGVGFEDFAFTQDLSGLPKLLGGVYQQSANDAVHNYGNLAPEYAMHGIAFKWAANSWVRGLNATMIGSHPIVTEVARNLQIEHNTFDGAWNKGKGGNGYLRGSRVWDSLWAYNTSRNLRHFTFQWSSSGNVAFRNDLDSDLNLHGGWERYNLFEGNTVRVPYEHRSGNCTANCGGEGGEMEDGTWFPIWWAAAAKAIKWSGSSGPQNVFHHNTLIKQFTPGGPFQPYTPYSMDGGDPEAIYQFGSDQADPRAYAPLSQAGAPIKDWSGRETAAYAGQGVAVRTGQRWPSLFLRDAGQLEPRDNDRRRIITWNMQGGASSEGGVHESKYGEVQQMISRASPVVALQEAGSPPRSFIEQRRIPQQSFNRGTADDPIFPPVVELRRGTNRSHYWLYWLHTDTSEVGNGRVNLAVATAERVDEVIVVTGGLPGARPALGVRIGETVFFSVHGFSPNGNDMAGTLRNVRAWIQQHPIPGTQRTYEWVVLGDFNREPSRMRDALPQNTFAVVGPRRPTHPTSHAVRTLDYAVTDYGIGAPQIFSASTMTAVRSSDHFPVAYDLTMRAGAGPVQLQPTPTMPGLALLRNAGTTTVADAEPGGGPLVPDTAYDPGRDQRWRLDPDTEYPGYLRLQHAADGRYLGLQDGARDGRAVLSREWTLDQLWRPLATGDGSWTLLNHATGQALTSIGGDFLLGARDPVDSAEQRWFLASQTDMTDRRDLLHVPAIGGIQAEVDVREEHGVEQRPVRLLQDAATVREWQPVPVGQQGDDRCFHLLLGDEYLTAPSAGYAPQPGTGVRLDEYRPGDEGQIWCAHQDIASMSVYNNTVVRGADTKVYLTGHGLGAQLTVELATGAGTEIWRWR